MSSRKEKAWVVVNERGWPFLDTIRRLKRHAIATYMDDTPLDTTWAAQQRKYGVYAVKCSVEVKDAR